MDGLRIGYRVLPFIKKQWSKIFVWSENGTYTNMIHLSIFNSHENYNID